VDDHPAGLVGKPIEGSGFVTLLQRGDGLLGRGGQQLGFVAGELRGQGLQQHDRRNRKRAGIAHRDGALRRVSEHVATEVLFRETERVERLWC
jgi:hypothetical protein